MLSLFQEDAYMSGIILYIGHFNNLVGAQCVINNLVHYYN